MTGNFEAASRFVRAATVALDVSGHGYTSQGTGFFVLPGIVATCAHVLGGKTESASAVVRASSAAFQGELDLELLPAGYRRGHDKRGPDVAFLRCVTPLPRPVASALLSPELEVGDELWAFGHPAGQFRGGQAALFTYQGLSRVEVSVVDTSPAEGDDTEAIAGLPSPGRVWGAPVTPGYSGSPVLSRRTGAVVGMLTTSDRAGSAHLVTAADLVGQLRAVGCPAENLDHEAWLAVLDDEQLRAGGWRYPGPSLRGYLADAIRAAGQLPHPGGMTGVSPPFLTDLYVRRHIADPGDGEGYDLPPADPEPDGGPKPAWSLRDMPAEDLLDGRDHVVVYGGPGSGKTSLLRVLLISEAAPWLPTGVGESGDVAGRRTGGRSVPIRVQATDLTSPRPLPEALAAAARADLSAVGATRVPDAEFFAREPMPGVSWLVLVDGLDEIGDTATRRAVLAKLSGALEHAPSASEAAAATYRYVLATRPLPSGELKPFTEERWRATHFLLRPLTSAQLSAYAALWFDVLAIGDPVQSAASFQAQLRATGLADMARTPLLAGMLCQMFAVAPDRQLPRNLGALYRGFVEMLQERQFIEGPGGLHEQARRILGRYGPSAEAAALAEADHALELVARFASARFEGAETGAAELLAAWSTARRPDRVPVAVWTSMLVELMRRSGLVVERAGDLEFVHRTFLEYLAARFDAADAHRRDRRMEELFSWTRRERFGARTWEPAKPDTPYTRFLLHEDPKAADRSRAREMLRVAGDAGLKGAVFVISCEAEGIDVGGGALDTAMETLASVASAAEYKGAERLRAAKTLTDRGDGRGPRLLTRLAMSDDLRRGSGRARNYDASGGAVLALADSADPAAADLLAEVAAAPVGRGDIRLEACAALLRRADERGVTALLELAADKDATASRSPTLALRHAGIGAFNSAYEAARVAESAGGDSAADLLARLARLRRADTRGRIEAARLLDLRGDARGAQLLADIAVDPDVDGDASQLAVMELSVSAHPSVAGLLHRAALQSDARPDQRRRAVTEALKRGQNVTSKMLAEHLGPETAPSSRLDLAELLIELRDPRGASVAADIMAHTPWTDVFSESPLRASYLLAEFGDQHAIDTLTGVVGEPPVGFGLRLAIATHLAEACPPHGIDVLADLASDADSAFTERIRAINELYRRGRREQAADLLAAVATNEQADYPDRFRALALMGTIAEPRGIVGPDEDPALTDISPNHVRTVRQLADEAATWAGHAPAEACQTARSLHIRHPAGAVRLLKAVLTNGALTPEARHDAAQTLSGFDVPAAADGDLALVGGLARNERERYDAALRLLLLRDGDSGEYDEPTVGPRRAAKGRAAEILERPDVRAVVVDLFRSAAEDESLDRDKRFRALGRLAILGDRNARETLYDLALHGSGSPSRPPWLTAGHGIDEQAAAYLAQASDTRVADILAQRAILRSTSDFGVFEDEMRSALRAALGLVRIGDARAADRLAALAADLGRITRSTDEEARYSAWSETLTALCDLGDSRAPDLASAFAHDAEPAAALPAVRYLAEQNDPRAPDLLVSLLSSDATEDTWRRAAAVLALAGLAQDGQPLALEVLSRIAADPRSAGRARLRAAAELRRTGHRSAPGLLAVVAEDPTVDGLVRLDAAALLIGVDERAMEIHYSISMDDTVDAMVRANAGSTLAESGDARALDGLAAALAASATPAARDHVIRAMRAARWALARRERRTAANEQERLSAETTSGTDGERGEE